jgi:hypothetical protein
VTGQVQVQQCQVCETLRVRGLCNCGLVPYVHLAHVVRGWDGLPLEFEHSFVRVYSREPQTVVRFAPLGLTPSQGRGLLVV